MYGACDLFTSSLEIAQSTGPWAQCQRIGGSWQSDGRRMALQGVFCLVGWTADREGECCRFYRQPITLLREKFCLPSLISIIALSQGLVPPICLSVTVIQVKKKTSMDA